MPIPGNTSSEGKKPTTPTIGSATAGTQNASVAFTPSTYIGKGTITYTAVSSPGGITGTSSSSPITVSSLTAGTSYTFTVVGNTNYGVSSDASGSSNPVIPVAPPVIIAAPVIIATPVIIIAEPVIIIAEPVIIIAEPVIIIAEPVIIIAEPPVIIIAEPPVIIAEPIIATCIPTPADFCGSLGGGTYVLTLDGYKTVNNLSVGDELLSLDISEIPTFGPDFDLTTWASEQFTNNGVVSTTVTGISTREVDRHMLVNGDWFSESHYILARKDGVHSFVIAADMDETYEVYNYQTDDWSPVVSVIPMNVPMTVYSINCEPYDIFFTENMLVYNLREFY
jgi:hypothetical protein